MLGSFQLQKRQRKNSHHALLPPTLRNSNLLSSQDQGQYISPEEFHELSEVEQKSCNSVGSHEPDKGDIEDVLMRMNYQNYLAEPQTPKLPKYPSMRLEDQQIIVVQEENQIGSDRGNNESVILQHIDFNQDKPYEETPQWEEQQKNKYKHDGVNYVIHYVDPPSEDIAQEHEQAQSSNQNDFSSYQFKPNKIRNSKQTEIARKDSRESDNLPNSKVYNKSCIAKPMHDEIEEQFSPPSHKQFDINNILSKWNQEIYPDLQMQYLNPSVSDNFKENKSKSLPFDMDRDAKYCQSYNGGSSIRGSSKQFQIENLPSNSGVQNLSRQMQTQGIGIMKDIKQGQSVKSLKLIIKQYEEQTTKMFEKSKVQRQQIARLKEIIKEKEKQIISLKQQFQQIGQNLNKQDKNLMEESRRLQNKNQELKKQINDQNETIKQYENKNQLLQKKLCETVSFNENSTKFFTSHLRNMSMHKFESFGQPYNKSTCDHSEFNSKIEALQEHIFDLQQQNVGLELQVEKRVKIMSDHMELQLRKSINQEFRMMLAALKEELGKQKQSNRVLQAEKNQIQEKCWSKERELKGRQEKVKNMYDQLVVEWKNLEQLKKIPIQKKSSFPILNNVQGSLSPKSTNYQYSNNRVSQASKGLDQFGSNFQANYFSNKDLTSTIPPKYSLSGNSNFQNNSSLMKQFQSPQAKRSPYNTDSISENIGSYARLTFGRENKSQRQFQTRQLHSTDLRQTYDLSVINNKIQRLRKEINRELDLIH